MMRVLVAIALLAASWMPALGYYHAPDATAWTCWAVLIVGACGLLTGAPLRMPSRTEAIVAALLVLPTLWLTPWPYTAIPILLFVGILLHLAPARWLNAIAGGAILVAAILVGQAFAMYAYESLTARSHELPHFLAHAIGWIARLIGIDAATVGNTITLGTMRKNHPLGATWELLLDPATLCFIIGGIIYLAAAWSDQGDRRPARTWLRASAVLVLLVIAWIPLRVAIHLGLFVHRAMISEYDDPLDLMRQFFSSPLQLLLLTGPVVLCWLFLRTRPTASVSPPAESILINRRISSGIFVAAGIFAVAFGLFWDPVGQCKAGRILVDEFPGDGGERLWEPTEPAMDTDWYGRLSAYNYACIYDYCSRFYNMGRIKQRISDEVLRDCDVLMIKVPTHRYTPEEIDAIERFVNRGGGLLLVGEHTNVFGTGQFLNDIASRFGFRFRYDCLFGIDNPFDERYERNFIPHPITHRMPPLEFATSCSVEPGWSLGRAAIRATALKSDLADYHASNAYPQVEDRAESRYGAFIQLYAMRSGAGRVVAFTDSTQWSNFCIFEPGKSELLMGMLEWLNHRSSVPDPRYWLLPIGLVLAGAGIVVARGWHGAWLVLLAVGLLSWVCAGAAVRSLQRHAMPIPKNIRPMVRVIVDQTVCSTQLPKNGFIGGKAGEFGTFERFILRVGYFTNRRLDDGPIDGNLIVFPFPDQPISLEFRNRLVDFVKRGGHILVIDSAENARSTANSILRPFEIEVDHTQQETGSVAIDGMPTVPVAGVCRVNGGEAFAHFQSGESGSALNGKSVGARKSIGRGSVTAIGYGTRYTDLNMGITGDTIPDQPMREVYETEYRLLRWIIEGPAATRSATTQPLRVETDDDRAQDVIRSE